MLSNRGFLFSVMRPAGLPFCAAALFAVCSAHAAVSDLSRDGVALTVESSPERIDLSRDFTVTVRAAAPDGAELSIPDLRDRFRGFTVAEDFAEEPAKNADGRLEYVSNWRLVPEPGGKVFKLAPFAVAVVRGGEKTSSFSTSPVYFEPPAEREPVTGNVEIDPKKDLPPLSWRLVRKLALWAAAIAAILFAAWKAAGFVSRRIKEHRMSPIERAMAELDRLLKRGLPGRGRYKDFYIELTMVVRRYIQRRHAVKAPNLTTEEFLLAAAENPAFPPEAVVELRSFLESADMVKFAGVESTPEMADDATGRAKSYLAADSRERKAP